MKPISVIIGLIVVGLLAYFFVISPARQTQVAETKEENTAGEDASETEYTELEFSEEELADYYIVYKEPSVIAIRTALTAYLADPSAASDALAQTAIDAGVTENGTTLGLDSFDKSYYKSKFVVMLRENSTWGGENIKIIFVDKPDKLFNVWMYKGPDDFRMEGFWQDKNFDEAQMKKLVIQHGRAFRDKEHSL